MSMPMSHLVIVNLLTAGAAYREAQARYQHKSERTKSSRAVKEAYRKQMEVALHRLHLCEDTARTFLDTAKQEA
jgi:hypothetical protein